MAHARMTRRTRWPAQPPRGLRPKLSAAQVRDLGICHLQNLDAIATGQADEATLWQVAGAAFTWSKVADMLGAGVPEMIPQLQLADALIERYGRTGKVLFTGTEYQIAKIGTVIMDELARATDRHTAEQAAEWSEHKINQLERACADRQGLMLTGSESQAAIARLKALPPIGGERKAA